MRRPLRSLAAFAAMVLPGLIVGTAARAEPLAGAEIQNRSAGGEFRGDTFTSRGFESHIWRFAADGGASAVASARRAPGNIAYSTIEFGDSGRWRVEGNRLCVAWDGPNHQFSGCYAVDAQQGDHVRMIGPSRWEGTLGR